MAARVADVFENGGVLLAEAGTGTGKTLAYLVPAILSRQRVLVSTGTKNLQEQIYFKDIPALATGAGRPVHRDLHEGARQLPVPASPRSAERRQRRRRRTTCSCRSSASGRSRPRPAIARSSRTCPRICRSGTRCRATAETCLGPECPRYDECFVTRMRQRAAASDVVIVNHHLLCADAAVRQNAFGEVIPVLQLRHRRRGAPARGRRHAVFRLLDQHLPRGGLRARRRALRQVRRRDDAQRAGRTAEGGRPVARSRASLLRRAGVRASDRRAASAAKSGSARPTSRCPHTREVGRLSRRITRPARSALGAA